MEIVRMIDQGSTTRATTTMETAIVAMQTFADAVEMEIVIVTTPMNVFAA